MAFRIKIRLILWVSAASVTGCLLYAAVVPEGKITYHSDFDDPNFFIRKLTPEERVLPPKDGKQAIVGDPAYFAVRTPRAFSHAKMTVVYQNPDNIPIIEAGVLADKKIWRYQTKPLENSVLDDLSAKWTSLRQGGTLLLQKEKRFDRIEDFLSHLPPAPSVAVYNFALAAPFRLPGYQRSTTTMTFSYPIRGAFQAYTYAKDEKLSFEFTVKDLNLNKDADPAEFQLWQGSRLVRSVKLADDGVIGDSGQILPSRTIRLEEDRLPEASYRIELVSNDDIVVTKIVTAQSKLSFINKVWFADDSKVPIVLDTDSQTVNVQTLNPAKLTTVSVGENKLPISETYRQYSVSTHDRLTEVVLPKSDLIVSGDGVFSIAGGSFIDPSFVKVTPNFYPGQRNISYVIADYIPPQSNQGWKTATAEFDLGTSAYREFQKYSFMISMPGLKAEEVPQRKLILKEISIEFSGSSLWDKIKSKIYGK